MMQGCIIFCCVQNFIRMPGIGVNGEINGLPHNLLGNGGLDLQVDLEHLPLFEFQPPGYFLAIAIREEEYREKEESDFFHIPGNNVECVVTTNYC
jgi:hypothetical protein